MDLQTIRYRGRAVAACTRERFMLAEELEVRPAGDPELTFVLFMCLYFRDVATGQLPGPYRDADARRFARACLIPAELLERPDLQPERAARALGVPPLELRTAQADRRAAYRRP